MSPSSPTAIEDRRTSIDVIIIRESAKATQAFVRWVPTAHMLADSLTKDAGEPVELLRVCLQHSEYQIAPESIVLERQAAEKERRKQARQKHQPSSEWWKSHHHHVNAVVISQSFMCILPDC